MLLLLRPRPAPGQPTKEGEGEPCTPLFPRHSSPKASMLSGAFTSTAPLWVQGKGAGALGPALPSALTPARPLPPGSHPRRCLSVAHLLHRRTGLQQHLLPELPSSLLILSED